MPVSLGDALGRIVQEGAFWGSVGAAAGEADGLAVGKSRTDRDGGWGWGEEMEDVARWVFGSMDAAAVRACVVSDDALGEVARDATGVEEREKIRAKRPAARMAEAMAITTCLRRRSLATPARALLSSRVLLYVAESRADETNGTAPVMLTRVVREFAGEESCAADSKASTISFTLEKRASGFLRRAL